MSTYAKQLVDDYRRGVQLFSEKMPEIARQYNEFTKVSFQEGVLQKKYKHLTALAISIKEQDETCITYHTHQCVELGCTDDEIHEILGVAAAFGGGEAMSKAVTTALEAVEEFRG
ncbi:hypothetical protein N781_16550 [Pontibacillus halophilus JSM 076056 = DSM 19796]|uniref:Carboxymuconolactone decarboxylase-like domain-containing protein n=1 Tax=Pontibacillus halophilus JSM 076056 = DSM 19796 TaxID=1385510 RepID=A0A0A5GGI9_9BACI|nr:carboxymuconolactone decarboxylase family protein [Pontibacillus halophilus]KGX92361.1 hypothetical protein N781_16550 [Pontibacillus halophilus JSM 076056 = DSM 19796]